jgi:hypothetical protein
MAGAGKKTFTAGETLTASDVNTYLMEQSVMYFGGTAARASAVPTPTTGMVSYVGDTGSETPASTIPQIEAYTGAAWQNMGGQTLLFTNTFALTSSLTIENIFTTAFANYKIVLDVTGATGSASTLFQLRTAAGVTASSAYASSLVFWNGTIATGATRATSSFTSFATSAGDFVDATLFAPVGTGYTKWFAASAQNGLVGIDGGFLNQAVSFTGLVLSTPGAIAGTIRIYGLRNS